MPRVPEYFDLYDEQGRPLGRSRERAQVHLDGGWHRSLFLWIVRADGRLIFQRRSHDKDTRPGLLTASVSGHYAAGEGLDEALREAREEIGIAARAEELIPLGSLREVDYPAPGLVDRELQDMFLWPLELPLAALLPDPVELAGLAEIAPADLLRLLTGQAGTLRAPYLAVGTHAIVQAELTRDDFVPTPQLHLRIADAALRHAAGERLPPDWLEGR